MGTVLGYAKRASRVAWQRFRRLPLWGKAIVVIALLALVGAALPGTEPSSDSATAIADSSGPQDAARRYILRHAGDSYRVSATIANVMVAYGQFETTPTQTRLYQLAIVAQQAHDSLNEIRHNFTYSDGGDLGDAEGNLLLGANDLKNAMGALVAVTNDSGPVAVAHFVTQFDQAKAEWNSGARTVWQTGGRPNPPTV